MKLLAQIVFIFNLFYLITTFEFKLSGSENIKCFRFRSERTKKTIKTIEFFYESKRDAQSLQVQLHDEIFKMTETGESKYFIFRNQNNK